MPACQVVVAAGEARGVSRTSPLAFLLPNAFREIHQLDSTRAAQSWCGRLQSWASAATVMEQSFSCRWPDLAGAGASRIQMHISLGAVVRQYIKFKSLRLKPPTP